MQIQKRRLGRTGIEVTCVGIGCLPLTGLDEQEASAVLNESLDLGVNFIDTARGYRESEALIGAAVSSRRGEYYLATKTRAKSEESIMEELHTSLKNLRTDSIDLYQIHYVNSSDELNMVLRKGGPLDVFKKLRRQGIIRFIGITGHNAAVMLEAARSGEFDTVQAAFSYIEKGPDVFDLIDYCRDHNVGFIDQKPLAGGALTCAPAALKWILQHPVSIVIPGMVKVEQVHENIQISGGDFSLSDEETQELERITSELDRDFCRRCYYCHPACPEEIRIGVVLEFYGKARYPENLELARRWYGGMKKSAADCTECGNCLSECPYELPIIDMLKEAHALLA
jgi:predicted aldo/keto reductase-like oxidoreductase